MASFAEMIVQYCGKDIEIIYISKYDLKKIDMKTRNIK